MKAEIAVPQGHSVEFWSVMFGMIFFLSCFGFRVIGWKHTSLALAASRIVAFVNGSLISYRCFQEYGTETYPYDCRGVWKLLDAPLSPRHLSMVCCGIGYFLTISCTCLCLSATSHSSYIT